MSDQPFGSYAPSHFARLIMRATQDMPYNGFGRKMALFIRKLALVQKQKIYDVVIDGIKIRAHLRDNISERKFVFMPQFCDPYERTFMKDILNADSVFCDIGANAGIYTLTAAQKITTGKIITIEPNPVMASRLKQNLFFNQWQDRAIVLEAAVGQEQGVLSLFLDQDNLGGSSLTVKKHKEATEIKVNVLPLDDILHQYHIQKIDLLKIDIEGAEDEALMPFFAKAPSSLYPKHIIIEDSRALWRHDLMALLQEKGYDVTARTRMNLILSRKGRLA